MATPANNHNPRESHTSAAPPAEEYKPRENHILGALPPEEYERLRRHMEPAELRQGETLTHADEQIRYAYFPHRGTISVVAQMRDGKEAEASVIGCEGMSGLPVVLGTDSAPLRTVVQLAGAGTTRLRAEVLRGEWGTSALRRLVLRYAQAFFVQAAQTAACNRLHGMEQRLARWLLMCHDRARTDGLDLTHEFISVMLGVRRAGVTEALGSLHRAGLIDTARGLIKITDRAGLERAACECYEVVRGEFARLTGQAPAAKG